MELSLAKPLSRKPLLLKDYLMDDLSSCSSNGFRSYPRRQCCTTVRFLLEIDQKTNPQIIHKKKQLFLKNPSKSVSSNPISAFQRASQAVINAVKHLPFASVKSPAILPRSLSRKLLKRRSFWKRTDHKEIQRLKPISEHDLIQENPTLPAFTIAGCGDSNSSTSESIRKSNSWSDSDFTASDDSLQWSSANSEVKIPNNNNIKKNLQKDKAVSSKRVGVIVGGDDSMDATTSSNSSTHPTNIKNQWANEEEKEQQFSPVSVLECPFDDDDDEVSSPFQHRLARMEGTKKRLMKKIQRFERLTQLEPVNLEKRIALSESDQESSESPLHDSSDSIQEDFILEIEEEEEENQADENAHKLLQLIKDTMPSLVLKLDLDKLLLDFFKEGLMENCCIKGSKLDINKELFDTANHWIIKGQPREMLMEWEVQKNREAYIRDMERDGKWRKLDEEKQGVSLELEADIFYSLVNDLVHDLL